MCNHCEMHPRIVEKKTQIGFFLWRLPLRLIEKNIENNLQSAPITAPIHLVKSDSENSCKCTFY